MEVLLASWVIILVGVIIGYVGARKGNRDLLAAGVIIMFGGMALGMASGMFRMLEVMGKN